MRAAFAWQNPKTEPSVPPERQLLLVNRVIVTREPPAAISASDPATMPTSRGTLPYLIQFTGPIMDEWQAAVRKTGALMRDYMPNNGWLVELTPAARQAIEALPVVQWVGTYEPGDKIQPFLAHLMTLFPSDSRKLDVTVIGLAPEDAAFIAGWLQKRKASLYSSEANSFEGTVRASVRLALIPELARLGEVQWIEEWVKPELYNDLAAIGSHMNVTSIWTSYRLTGKGQIVGHADTGLDIGATNGIHPDFADRVLAAYALGRPGNWSDVDAHGTHTAGSILGDGAMSAGQYRGMAWEAKIVHQSVEDSSGYLSGIPSSLTDLFLPTYTNGARVHSDSWGSDVYGYYDLDARSADSFMWNYPKMLVVFSAGNAGQDTDPANGVVDPDSIGSPGTAKNVLTVGAMENDRPYQYPYGATWITWGDAWPSDYPVNPIHDDYISYSYTTSPYRQGMAAFSSRGPTDDGRIKPDVVAPGTDVISPRSRAASGTGWGVAANNNYLYMGGTSMSCPLVAGLVLLIRQYLVERAGVTEPSAALMKAMLIGGSRSMTPGQYGTGAFQEIPSLNPNSVEGFGQVDAARSVYPTGSAIRVWDDQALTTGTAHTNTFTVAATNASVSVTLAWTDYRGSTGAGIKLVNDYDLLLVGPDGTTNFANGGSTYDRLNTVEKITVTNAANGQYRAIIKGFNIPQTAGRYALVVRAPMDQKPELIHTPPGPVLMCTNACPLTALATYYAPLTNGEVKLFWTTNGTPGPFNTVSMNWQEGHAYTGSIPSQPIGVAVQYYLSVTVSTYEVRYPTNAPLALQQVVFSNPPVSFIVAGTRTNSTVVDPTYGSYTYPSGSLVHATAQSVCLSGTTWRFLADGWTGTGTEPASSNGHHADVILTDHAVLTWQWREEALLTQNSSPSGAVDQTSWHLTTSTAATVTAWSFASDGTTNYGLAGWKVDGALWTNEAGQAPNPVTNIVMDAPHIATAWYLPYWTDSDANSLLDWWEYRHFGTTGVAVASSDPDGDGWINQDENLDNTDPWNSNSFPTPPAIFFTPLADPQTTAPPWTISATITDNFTVADAAVFWTVNDGALRTNYLAYVAGDVYRTELDPGSATVVTMLYQLAAVDLIAQTDTAVYSTESLYPIFRSAPTNFGTVRLSRLPFDQPVTVANDGNQPLVWRASPIALVRQDDMEGGVNGWSHFGANDSWHLSGLRYASPSNAWYCGSVTGPVYAAGMEAWLVSTSFTVGGQALMTVRHWMRAEPDSGDYYWDGGVVRITTNGGVTFNDLSPAGGYPHKITPNDDSPFAPDTPCFGRNDWIESRFDLSAFSGTVARIAFVFGSDLYTQDEGWYIDDVWIGSAGTDTWMAATGVVAGTYAPGIESAPFALTVPPWPMRSQADVQGAIRVDHSGPVRGGIELLPYRFRRPGFLTVDSGPYGQSAPLQADLLDAESTQLLAQAAAGARILSVTTNGIAVPETFGFGSTQYARVFQAPASDISVTVRFSRVWSVSVESHGPGTAQPVGIFSVDDGASTNVQLQADSGQVIWNVVLDGAGVPAAGGLASYNLPIAAISTNRNVLSAFGGNTLTGLPAAVEADWMRSWFPNDWNFDALALLDQDGDGMVTWKEYVCATIPTNAASVLRMEQPPLLSNTVSALNVSLQFQSVTGKTYQAQTAPELAGPWVNTGALVTATGAIEALSVELPAGTPRAFFRVRVEP